MPVSSFHVALIMDGNGRWATNQGKPRLWGHKQGAKVLKGIIRCCPNYGITHLTAYAFSPENWKRGPGEVGGLMSLFQIYLRAYTQELNQEGVRLCIIGDIAPLPPVLRRLIARAQDITQYNNRLILQIALNYGGRDDLIQATQHLVARYQAEKLDPATITRADIEELLWTKSCPDPDLLIRTGGEMRLSNYMLWQLCYTELLFLPEYWPDFTPEHLEKAVHQFRSRQRRFGGLPDAIPSPIPLIPLQIPHFTQTLF
jgi:undecaprenyl diphosphate synthase